MVIGGIGSVAAFPGGPHRGAPGGPALPVRHADSQHQRRRAAGFPRRPGAHKDAALLAGTAFVGAYTTFSTWMLETQRLSEERQVRPAVANIVVSVVLGFGAALLGQWIAEQL